MKIRPVVTGAWIGGFVIIALIVAGAVIFVPRWMAARGEEATTAVGSKGFELQIGEIRIVGDPGVAPAGTQVKAKVVAGAPVSGAFAAGVSVSPGIEIELGDDLQPKAEISIELPLHERSDNDLTPVFAVQEHAGKAMTADFDISDSRSRGIIRTRQLSVFGFIQIGKKDLQDWFLDQFMEFFDLSVKKPECFTEEFELFGSAVSLVSKDEDAAWLCFSEGNRPQIDMTLELNTPGVWLFKADVPHVENSPTTTDLPSVVLFSLFRSHPGQDPNTALAMPRVTSDVTFSGVPSTVAMKLSTGYTVVWSVLSVAAGLIPMRNLQGLEHAQCIADLVVGSNDSSKTVKSIASCIAEFAGNAGLIFGLLASAPASFFADVSGIVREASGKTVVTFALERGQNGDSADDLRSDTGAGSTQIQTYTPFDADGRTRPDVTVDDRTDLEALSVDSQPSPSATRTGTYWLGATADSASACWENPDQHATVICLENPWSDATFTRTIDGQLPASPAASDPVLWAMELWDGSRWQLRTGGSWSGRPDGWSGIYRCIENCQSAGGPEQAILADDEHPHGYDDSAKQWTAFVGEIGVDDPAPPDEVPITQGWFVG